MKAFVFNFLTLYFSFCTRPTGFTPHLHSWIGDFEGGEIEVLQSRTQLRCALYSISASFAFCKSTSAYRKWISFSRVCRRNWIRVRRASECPLSTRLLLTRSAWLDQHECCLLYGSLKMMIERRFFWATVIYSVCISFCSLMFPVLGSSIPSISWGILSDEFNLSQAGLYMSPEWGFLSPTNTAHVGGC